MPYVCFTDPSITFASVEEVEAAQAAAIASGDLARINTVHDLSWVAPEEDG